MLLLLLWCLWGCGQRACVVHISRGSRSLEHFARRPVGEGLVQAFVVVEDKPPADAAARLANRGIGLDEHLLIFQAAPQAFDEDVVEKPPLAVHADPHTAGRQLVISISSREISMAASSRSRFHSHFNCRLRIARSLLTRSTLSAKT